MVEPGGPSRKKAGRDLPVAIAVGLGLFAAVTVGLLWLPWFFALFMAAALGFGTIELHHALTRKGMRSEVVPVCVGTVVSSVGSYAAVVGLIPLEPVTMVLICLCLTMIAAFALRLRRGPEGFVGDAAASALIVAYLPMLGASVPLLMAADDGTLRILTIIACVVASDTGAFAVGVLLGRHKMAPTISPNKTWEGFAGGIAFAALVGVLAAVYLLQIHWVIGLVLGVLLSLAGTTGDLVESLIKRDVGLKDMSNFLPGHGGVMDRLDSILIAVPVGWMIFHLTIGS
ncbi:phosphatidate cytidylyltransferase [Tessaracoccus bendigoensis DSM 12906]|uniref:Phosphatidate cytidylyltransferase n=1 Tax=Tessaracoccus bendigoensis DSM 12906 TaxID=1123357 RepID=A0A1M6IM54_9ACTN|nr:CDP-archaeol synthase [Tessaracoccus bendigoensis]SHJ35463.1 phosphatidate cytidylyltransferase [Tessaracoccus bendigoensis DSM 12906]